MPDTAPPPRSTTGEPPAAGARWVDAFRTESLSVLLPLLGDTLQQAARAIGRAEGSGTSLAADLSVLRSGLIRYEQRWQHELAEGFRDWPRPATPRPSSLTLLTNEELNSQLIGEPTIEALDRRFHDALEHISSRLHTLAAQLGENARPSNPVAPRHLVEAFLRALPETECVEELRLLLLPHFERVCGATLPAFYSRINVQLAEAGVSLQSGGPSAFPAANAHDALDARQADETSGWRQRVRQRASSGLDQSPRGRALRQWLHARHPPRDLPPGARTLQDGEFLAVLSLLQADPGARPDHQAPDLAAQLRVHIVRGAANLGIDPDMASLGEAQADASLLAGALLGGLLAGHALDDEAAAQLAGLAYPLTHQLMIDPGLVDDASHPARCLLDELLWSLDANHGASAEESATRDSALRAAQDVLSDLHEPERAFGQALEKLQAYLEPLRTRAALVRRRLVQSVEGRERRDAARQSADAALASVAGGQRLLRHVSAFLSDQWHHALTQAWLRHGEDSEAYARAADAGRRLVELDQVASRAEGTAVARGVLELEPVLREVLLANGLDGERADAVLAPMVYGLAHPDEERPATPAAGVPGTGGDARASGAALQLQSDDWLTIGEGRQAVRAQVGWYRAATGSGLLLNRAGQRAFADELTDLSGLYARGQLRVHRAHGPVEDLLQAWEALPA